MNIRRGDKNDVLKVSRLWLQMTQELAPELTPNAYWWREMAAALLKQDNYFMFVAEEGGKLCGFIDYFLFPEPATGKRHCVGQHFYILPEYRKTGLAGDLWRGVLKISKAQGAQVWELFCFTNEKPMWEHHGFQPQRILMRKEA